MFSATLDELMRERPKPEKESKDKHFDDLDLMD
jgi:hypothetical protein